METLALKQATTHPSSHGEDEASEGGWSGYPSDHQTALEKLHVAHSDNRDQAEEMLESETSGPVSDRTRAKIGRRRVVMLAEAADEMVTIDPSVRAVTRTRHLAPTNVGLV